jgi:heat shock protein HtpX
VILRRVSETAYCPLLTAYRLRRIWSILNNQEKVAVLAHELAHHINHDPTRSLFIGNAINTLWQWYGLLNPANTARLYSVKRAGLIAYISEIFANLVLQVLCLIPWSASYGLHYLLLRDRQRAEYRADYLAATVSGTAAMLSLMDKTQFYRTFNLLAQKVSLYYKDRDLFVEMRKRTAEVPPRELERIKRLSEVEMSRLDVTHPPTLYRIKFLAAQPRLGKSEIMSPAEFEQLERETAGLQPAIQKQVVKAYHAGLISR